MPPRRDPTTGTENANMDRAIQAMTEMAAAMAQSSAAATQQSNAMAQQTTALTQQNVQQQQRDWQTFGSMIHRSSTVSQTQIKLIFGCKRSRRSLRHSIARTT